jgi:hypothetical protein
MMMKMKNLKMKRMMSWNSTMRMTKKSWMMKMSLKMMNWSYLNWMRKKKNLMRMNLKQQELIPEHRRLNNRLNLHLLL